MAVGQSTSQGQISQVMGQIATDLRDIFTRIDNANDELESIGLPALQSVWGFDSADAETLVSTIGNLETLSQIYQGIAVGQALPFNFKSNSTALWGSS